MTAHAEHSGVELLRLHRSGIVCVFGQRPVTTLTGDVCVLALILDLQHVRVAGLTGTVSGVGDRPGFDFTEGIAAVVTVLPETARHQRIAQEHEDDQTRNKEKGHPQQVFRILELHAHCLDPCRSSREL